MRAYSNGLSEVTGAVAYTPVEMKNAAVYTGTTGPETWVIASPYKRTLDFRPQRATLAATIAGAAAALLDAPTAPQSAGQVSVDWESGTLTCHSSDGGKTLSVTYKSLGSVIDATVFNTLQESVNLHGVEIAGGSVGHTQNTDTGTTSAVFAVNSDAASEDTTATLRLRTHDDVEALNVNVDLVAATDDSVSTVTTTAGFAFGSVASGGAQCVRWRGSGGSLPSTDLRDGDLAFDTANETLCYYANATVGWQAAQTIQKE